MGCLALRLVQIRGLAPPITLIQACHPAISERFSPFSGLPSRSVAECLWEAPPDEVIE